MHHWKVCTSGLTCAIGHAPMVLHYGAFMIGVHATSARAR